MSTHSPFFFKLSLLQSRALTFLSSSPPFCNQPISHTLLCMASPSALSVLALLVFIISSLCIFSEAKEFLVGDKTNSWQMPSFPSQSLNKWAEANRFQVGDSLVWKFSNEKDSVLVVTKGDYESCNVSNPVAAHKGGNVTVVLDRSGSFYFISGVKGRCEKGEKMVVVVMTSGGFFPDSPAPSPSEFSSTAIPPTSSSPGLVVLRSGFAWGVLVLGVLGQLFGMVL